MAYHHFQGSHGASWSHTNNENQEATPSSLTLVTSSGPEQAFGATSPLSELQTYGQGWNHEISTYSQDPPCYYPYHNYQQSSTVGHNTCGASNFATNRNAVAGSQKNLGGNYTSSDAYPRSYEYVNGVGKDEALLTWL